MNRNTFFKSLLGIWIGSFLPIERKLPPYNPTVNFLPTPTPNLDTKKLWDDFTEAYKRVEHKQWLNSEIRCSGKPIDITFMENMFPK